MVQGTAPTFVKQVIPADTYYAKLIADDISEFDDYDFASGSPTGEKIFKYWADLEIDGVEDENVPGQCFRKRLFFKIVTGERANLPKFLRAIGIPLDEKTGDFDTGPAVGRAWVTLSVNVKPGKLGGMTNVVESYTKDKSHKASDHPRLPDPVLPVGDWGDEAEPVVPF